MWYERHDCGGAARRGHTVLGRGRAHANTFCGELFISYGVNRAIRREWYVPARVVSAPVTPFASRKPLRPNTGVDTKTVLRRPATIYRE